jgi:tRNA G10  N-methylase Trm11
MFGKKALEGFYHLTETRIFFGGNIRSGERSAFQSFKIERLYILKNSFLKARLKKLVENIFRKMVVPALLIVGSELN